MYVIDLLINAQHVPQDIIRTISLVVENFALIKINSQKIESNVLMIVQLAVREFFYI